LDEYFAFISGIPMPNLIEFRSVVSEIKHAKRRRLPPDCFFFFIHI